MAPKPGFSADGANGRTGAVRFAPFLLVEIKIRQVRPLEPNEVRT